MQYSNPIYEISWPFPVIFPTCERTFVIVSHHRFLLWLSAASQQAITRANVDQYLCRHMAQFGHNDLQAILENADNDYLRTWKLTDHIKNAKHNTMTNLFGNGLMTVAAGKLKLMIYDFLLNSDIRLIKLATKLQNKVSRAKYGGRGLKYFLVHQSYHNNNSWIACIISYLYIWYVIHRRTLASVATVVFLIRPIFSYSFLFNHSCICLENIYGNQDAFVWTDM